MRSIQFLLLFATLISLSACCAKKDCDCPEPKIETQTRGNYPDYFLVRTTKTFVRIDSVPMILYRYNDSEFSYHLDKYSFNFDKDESLEDFNYLIKSINKEKLDTISGISFKLESYSFECNDCFLKKDIVRCENIIEPKLTLNRKSVNELIVSID